MKQDLSETERIRQLYDKAPFPEVFAGKMPQSNVLLTHWVNAVSPSARALGPGSNILLAGCGSGAEGIMLAKLFPESKVWGLDFSQNSIRIAKELGAAAELNNLCFEIADLMDSDSFQKFPKFDFMLCHGVADYVSNPAQLFKTFDNCLSDEGVICMTVNSSNHPAGRIRAAFAALGINPADFTDSAEQRRLLQLVDKLMGNDSGLQGIGQSSKSYLDVDIFAPIAHHVSLEQWCLWAEEKGLVFAASLDAIMGIMQVTDDQLPLLYTMNKASLSRWMYGLCRRPGIQMLFCRQRSFEPCFDKIEQLLEWVPKLDASVAGLPELISDPDELKILTLRFQDFPDFVINTSAYDLEVLRRCQGQKSLKEIIEDIGLSGNMESLRAALFRAYHYGFLV